MRLNQQPSATLLQNVIQHTNAHPTTGVSYFYFDFNDSYKQSSRNAIRSLLFQFAVQIPDCLQDLKQLHQNCKNGHEQPAEDEIRSLLRDTIAHTEQKYIILDALDECMDREDLLIFLRKLVKSKQTGLHILVTSRGERDIEEQLRAIADHVVNIQSAVVDEDIRVYIRDQLTNDKSLKEWPPSVQDVITTELMAKAAGMYVYLLRQLHLVY